MRCTKECGYLWPDNADKWQARAILCKSINEDLQEIIDEFDLPKKGALRRKFNAEIWRMRELAENNGRYPKLYHPDDEVFREKMFCRHWQDAERVAAKYWSWRYVGGLKHKPKHWDIWEDCHAACMVFINNDLTKGSLTR